MNVVSDGLAAWGGDDGLPAPYRTRESLQLVFKLARESLGWMLREERREYVVWLDAVQSMVLGEVSVCGVCGQPGHTAQTCRVLRLEGIADAIESDEKQKKMFPNGRLLKQRRGPRKCSVCNEYGHDARNHGEKKS